MRYLLLSAPSVNALIRSGNQCNHALLFHISWVMVKMLCLMGSLHVTSWFVQAWVVQILDPCPGLVGDSAEFRSPAGLLVPCRCPQSASPGEVLTIGETLLAQSTRHQGVAMGIHAMGEVLACHAGFTPPKRQQLTLVHKSPLLHHARA